MRHESSKSYKFYVMLHFRTKIYNSSMYLRWWVAQLKSDLDTDNPALMVFLNKKTSKFGRSILDLGFFVFAVARPGKCINNCFFLSLKLCSLFSISVIDLDVSGKFVDWNASHHSLFLYNFYLALKFKNTRVRLKAINIHQLTENSNHATPWNEFNGEKKQFVFRLKSGKSKVEY